MALQTTITHLKELLDKIKHDIHKAERGNKAASQRVRTMTVRLEKVAKTYRKESIHTERQTKGGKKPTKKFSTPTKIKGKAKPKTKAALARPRALAFKKPTAKLPVRRPGMR